MSNRQTLKVRDWPSGTVQVSEERQVSEEAHAESLLRALQDLAKTHPDADMISIEMSPPRITLTRFRPLGANP